jgi:hypothetical protein
VDIYRAIFDHDAIEKARISRRATLVGIAGVAGIVVAGCGAQSDSQANTPSAGVTATSTEATTTAPTATATTSVTTPTATAVTAGQNILTYDKTVQIWQAV